MPTNWPMVPGPQPKGRKKIHGGPYSVRTEEQVLDHRIREAEWYKQGQPMAYMAQELGVDLSVIKNDLHAIREDWRERAINTFEDKVWEEVAKIDYVEAQAWQQFFASIGEVETTATSIKTGLMASETVTVHTKKQSGPVAYLNVVLSCIDRRCKLLGLDAPEKSVSVVLAKVYTGFDPSKV
jgi:hypothetical protein